MIYYGWEDVRRVSIKSCEEDPLKAACDHNLNWPREINTFEFDTFKPN